MLHKETDGSAEDDLALMETEIVENAGDRIEAGLEEVDDQTTNLQVAAPEIIQVDCDLTLPESTEDGPSIKKATAAEKRTKSREDKRKGVVVSKKMSTSKAGLTNKDPFQKTFCITRDDPDRFDKFSFQFVGSQHLMEDREAVCQLVEQYITSRSRDISEPGLAGS